MKSLKCAASVLGAAVLLAACGGGSTGTNTTPVRGGLVADPVAVTSLTPAAFEAAAPASLFLVAGKPKCTVTFNYIQYGTVGGANEATTGTGAVMVPSGADAACQGPRPVLLYAHGTSTDKNKNMAVPTDSEAALVAAIYAAQGYIVVAPNYAGYEQSTLPYHPYLNIDQQSKDMIDGLGAARAGFAKMNASASAKLFLSGYSQGGHVSMATQRAMQLAGETVTAGAHLSGPYNLGGFGDAVYAGNVNLGATIFSPLLTTSFQRAYGNIYTTPADVYESTFATGIESLLPSTTSLTGLITAGKLPATFMFEGTLDGSLPPAQFAPFFGKPNLIKTTFRQAVVADITANPTVPTHPLRIAANKNDMLKLDWTPTQPMLLCGGKNDPTVFFNNAPAAQAYFIGKGVPAQAVTVLDVDSAIAEPFIQIKGGFAQALLGAGGITSPAAIQAYHGSLVPPFCNAAAKGYFGQF
jgi:Secretory lipase